MSKIKFLIILINIFFLIFLVYAASNQQCNGCQDSNGKCYSFGDRAITQNNSKVYCDISGNILSQKSNNFRCDNNFECLSDLCSNGECADIYGELSIKKNIAENIEKEIVCEDECTREGEKKCSNIDNYQVCGRNYDRDSCLEWGSSTSCPMEYDEQTKCKMINKSQIVYKNPIIYTGRYKFNVKLGQSSITKIDVYIPTLTEWDSQRDIEIISFSPNGIMGIESTHNNKYLHFDKSQIMENKLPITQDIKFTSYEVSANISLENISKYNTNSALYKTYIKNENKIETDFFKTLTPTIMSSEINPIRKAKKIYDYVIDNLNYFSMNGQLGGAQYAYTHKGGECGDYSALFVAMARSVGIPARPVVGFWISGEPHVWAEFYVQDIGWIPVDPTIGQQSLESRNYYFGNLDNKRLIMSKNYNIPLNEYNTDLFQVGAYWWQGSGSEPTIDFSYEKLGEIVQPEVKEDECTRWCGDGVCSNINQGYWDDDPWGGQWYGLNYQETCLTCSQDCGSCVYGVQGANGDAICGVNYNAGGYIRRKIGNIDVSSPEIMKTKINEWIYSKPDLYNQVKNGQFDAAVQELANHMWEIYFSSGYCITACPSPGPTGNAPTSASGILNGQCGLCADYANLWLSLLRTMNVPSNRVYVLCYQTVNPNYWGHCVTAYKSDSGEPWILDYGNIYSSLSQGYACKTPDWAHWGNDDNYGWASFKNIKCE